MAVWLAVATTLSVLPLLLYLRGAVSHLGRLVSYSDLSIRRMPMESGDAAKPGELIIRVACVGDRQLIVDDVGFKSRLEIKGRRKQLRLGIALVISYITNDVEGLATLFGPHSKDYFQKTNRMSGILNRLLGVSALVLYVDMMINPLFWIAVAFLGPPYVNTRLFLAGDQDIKITSLEDGSELRRPFIIVPGIHEYRLSCALYFKGRDFPRNATLAYVTGGDLPTSMVRMPRPGKLAWHSDEQLLVRIRGKVFAYSASLKGRLVTVSMPRQEKPKTKDKKDKMKVGTPSKPEHRTRRM